MSSENTRVLIAGINQFINTVVSYINISNRDFASMVGPFTDDDFSAEEGRIIYALIVRGLLTNELKNIDTQGRCSNYPTATSVAEHLLQTARRGIVGNSRAEDFEMMEVYGVSHSAADPRKGTPFPWLYESYTRTTSLRIVYEYIARSMPAELRCAPTSHTC
jgi:hypothetical protein